MKKWNLVPIVALFGLIGAGCADGFSIAGARTIDDGAPAPVTVPASDQQGNTTGSGEPPAAEPPVTEPPVTEPPVTEPPPTTTPPTTEPPVTEPPPTTTPPTTEPPVTEPAIREATVTVTLIRFQAIKDCDGIEGVGEFNFEAFVATADGQVKGSTGGYRELTDLDYWNHLKEVTFTLPEQQGSAFDVVFTSSEVDKDIFANVYNDDRMDGLRNTGAHSFSGGVWTSPPMVPTDLAGDRYGGGAVQLRTGSGNCSAELHYVVDIT